MFFRALLGLTLCSAVVGQDVSHSDPRAAVRPLIQAAKQSQNVSYSPDGGEIAVCTKDYVEIRTADTLSLVREIKPVDRHTYGPKSPRVAAWSPDGKLLAIAAEGLELRDGKTGELVKSVDENPHGSDQLSFSPDGSYLVAVSQHSMPSPLRVWHLPDGVPVVAGHFPSYDEVQGVSFLGTDRLAVVYIKVSRPMHFQPYKAAEYEARLAILDMKTGFALKDFSLDGSFITGPFFLGEQGQVAVLVREHEIEVWNLESQKRIAARAFPALTICDALWMREGHRIAAVGVTGSIQVSQGVSRQGERDPLKTAPLVLWDYKADKVDERHGFPTFAWNGLAEFPRGGQLMLAGPSGLCRLSVQDDRRVVLAKPMKVFGVGPGVADPLELRGNRLESLETGGPEGNIFGGSGRTTKRFQWDLASGSSLGSRPLGPQSGWGRGFLPQRLKTLEDGSVVHLDDDGNPTAPPVGKWPNPVDKQSRRVRQVWSAPWLATSLCVKGWESWGGPDKNPQPGFRVGLLNTASGTYTEFPDRLGEPITALAFSPDNRFLAIGYSPAMRAMASSTASPPTPQAASDVTQATPVFLEKDHLDFALSSSILVWDLKAGQRKYLFPEAMIEDGSLAFSPDGKYLASVSPDPAGHGKDKLDLWALDTGSKAGSWDGAGWMPKVFFTPDADHLIESSMHDGFEIIDLRSLSPSKNWKDPEGPTDWVALQEEGRVLVSLNREGHIRFWSIPSGDLLLTLQNLTAIGSDRPDWVCYTPDGRYDGSDGIESMLSWESNGKVIQGESWEKKHRVSGLMGHVLDLKR